MEHLFKQFEEVNNKRQRKKIAAQIVLELTIHANVEGSIVYPVLRKEDKEGTLEAVEEHHVVKMLLSEIATFDGDSDVLKAKVTVLTESVKHHIEEEEKELFPKLQKSGVDLNELGAQVIKLKEKLKARFSEKGAPSKRQILASPRVSRKLVS